MPAPSIILPKPLIMIQPGDSYLSGTSINTPINFGNIVLVQTSTYHGVYIRGFDHSFNYNLSLPDSC
jgi:hypothetical protein